MILHFPWLIIKYENNKIICAILYSYIPNRCRYYYLYSLCSNENGLSSTPAANAGYTKRYKGITIRTQKLKSTHVDKVNQGSIKYILKQFCEQLIII